MGFIKFNGWHSKFGVVLTNEYSVKIIGLNRENRSVGSSYTMSDEITNPETSQELRRIFVVKNKTGIHARPAAMIVRIANKYSGNVWVVKDTEQVDGKSIMGLMMLAAGNGSKLEFIIDDAQGEAFLDEIETLFANKFEES